MRSHLFDNPNPQKMKTNNRIHIAIQLLVLSATLSLTALAQAQTNDLTGVWNSGGATFYVRQLDKEIWWFGERSPTNPFWTNVAQGTVDGSLVHMKWVDVPMGQTRSEGTLTLRIVDSKHLKVEENPNNFWDRDWYRQ
jgi:hypothetical protein